MCGIAGINSIESHHVGDELVKMLKTMKHRGPDGSGVYIDGQIIHGRLDDIEVPEGSFGLGHNLLSIVGSEVSQPIQSKEFTLIANAEIYNFREVKNRLGENYKTDSDCEVIISVVNKFYRGSLLDAVEKSLDILDGDYAFAIYDGKDQIVVRDPLGVKPVYYGNDKSSGVSAFASERKALWKIGIEDVSALKPDHVLLNGNTVKIKSKYHNIVETHRENDIKVDQTQMTSYQSIKDGLRKLIVRSVEKRVYGLSKVGIIFSGGVDSTLLAKITSDLGVDTRLYTVGLESSGDVKFARLAAEKLNLPLKVRIINDEIVKKYTEPVLDAIEEFNIMKLGVGMPSFMASEMASLDNLKVVMSGQGADELFAGYNRYINLYNEKKEDAFDNILDDLEKIYHVNLQRDDGVTMANSVELRVPYLDKELVDMAIKIPMKYKMECENNLRKCILREVASDLGVPKEIVSRPKKAAQYGSGVHKILVKKVLKDVNYKSKLEAMYTNKN